MADREAEQKIKMKAYADQKLGLKWKKTATSDYYISNHFPDTTLLCCPNKGSLRVAELLFTQSNESLQETTSFNLIAS